MIKFIKHYFVPHKGNNHRSKIIHNSSLLVLVVLLLFTSWLSILVNKTNPEILGISYSMSDQELLLLVNQERIEKGLSPLKMNAKLTEAAKGKANHMMQNNYWAHFAPDGTTPWKFIISSGYDYMYAGENLAKGFVNSSDAVDAWMDSPTHRDNILSNQYSDVGFAIVEGNLQGEDTVLVVEIFGYEKSQYLAKADLDLVESTSSEESDLTGSDSDANKAVDVPLLGVNSDKSTDNSGRFQINISEAKPIVDLLTSAKTFSFVLLSVLLIAFIIDFLVIAKKRIPRLVGNNLDHILLLSVFIVFIFIYNMGRII